MCSSIVVPQSSVPITVKRLTKTLPESGLEVGTGIEVTWSTGERTSITSMALRTNCPCATCQEERGDTSHRQPLIGKSSLLRVIKASAAEQSDLRRIWTVGNYALGLSWGDKHDSGIFTFRHLVDIANREGAEIQS